ncbi:MAG: PstS family phosphate ABC transporter substrate-binding protein [Rhodospirillaceae bacterium]|nr:PstS family phosphate ABC transporter substrate-binding protein [Rhodospirillaceae bacterium]MBT4043035.1 PstS family phosphate ABC transporter substrate-binding protein [Rhodospirillaceae bacterium]MBT4690984.1 PstS family phosphate ABC transporter substrate-binding protein [Rhodospirillaceae bacterium]MBT5079962.1 PstS family phosphate ABC transporter substrate-binding protein [Rhodospirillaceae bacterium]MBT5525984.1 PstS family phosphate ABC transporter substrate-binding protein [Rhodosp
MLKTTLTMAALITVAMTSTANMAMARDQIRIVGSSTVFPFATAVAERFGKTSSFKTPVVESTGSGGGLKLFCSGIGASHPDITNASRRIKASEVSRCAKNGIANIVEVKIGFDGIVLANSRKTAQMSLTLKQLFLALAKDVPIDGKLVVNPYKTWNEIDPALPATKIEVLGPPPTSGTRDAFVELAMEGGAKKIPLLKAMRKADKKHFKAVAHALREDGAFIEAGENDNLIVQKLEANPLALGIFGFSFLDQNRDKLQGSSIGGVLPEFELIAEGTYPISRTLYFYVKKAHVGTVPGLQEYVAAFANDQAWGPDGYLADKGLIPLPDAERATTAKQATALINLSM